MPRTGRPENLIPMNKLTEEKQREIASMGGKRSVEVRRAKKSLSERVQLLAETGVTEKMSAQMKKNFGIEDATYADAVSVAVVKGAITGDPKMVDKFQELTEAINESEKAYELPARVIGKAFVDINRQIEPNKTYVFEGGRGGLKSSYVSLKIIELIKNNPTMHACIVRKVAGTLRDSVYAQMKWAINELDLNEQFECNNSLLQIKYKKTGQIIYFRGVDDPTKLKSIKPPFGYIGILWKEEKDQLSGAEEERNINQSVLRGGDVSYDFSSYNPPKSSSSWVNREKLMPDKNRIIHTSTYLDAPPEWLGRKFIDDAEHLKEVNPSAYEHEYMGIPNGEGGNVFEYIELRTITDAEITRQDTIYQGVDWGWYPDPFCFVRLGYEQAQDTIYFMDEYYVNKESNASTAEWIKNNGYDDYPITCDSAEPKSIQDFKDAGLPARPAIKGAGSVDYGMKWLAVRKIVIDPERTPNVAREFMEYEYERDKEGNVVSGYPDSNNHSIDATRYAIEKFYNRRGNSA